MYYIITDYISNESLPVINHKRQQSYYNCFTKCSTVLLSVIMTNEKETINFIVVL